MTEYNYSGDKFIYIKYILKDSTKVKTRIKIDNKNSNNKSK